MACSRLIPVQLHHYLGRCTSIFQPFITNPKVRSGHRRPEIGLREKRFKTPRDFLRPHARRATHRPGRCRHPAQSRASLLNPANTAIRMASRFPSITSRSRYRIRSQRDGLHSGSACKMPALPRFWKKPSSSVRRCLEIRTCDPQFYG